MTPDASRWRSSTYYDHVEGSSASDIAWEWLRRNEAYDLDFENWFRNSAAADTLSDQIRQRWGLRFPGRSDPRCSRGKRFLGCGSRHQHRPPRTGSRRKPLT
ncbi:MAG: DUF6499 domain-containing protein [Pseudomonadota bacterium]|uniref:transcriptional regulator domain-containing protein n=1 Tax=Pannonibacter carbonis TaxID=2067569 RepID=UPI000D0EFDC9|nr:DUF6499 domain-containing protein [Pannonibacter carbonis]